MPPKTPAMPIPFAVGNLEAVVLLQAVFVPAAFADGMRGVGLEIGEQVDVPGLLDLFVG